MNISDFRKDLSNQFNQALKKPIVIERGGVAFELRAKGLIGTVITKHLDPERDEFVPTNSTKTNTFNQLRGTLGVKLCKVHGTQLDDRGRCLMKGCK